MTIDSDLNNVALVGVAVHAICGELAREEDLCCQIELALVEAVNNAVIHAYEKKTGGKISVTMEILPENLVFQVRDNGKGIPPNCLNPLCPEPDPENRRNLQTGGRGLFIISEIMDEVFYRETEEGNLLTLTKRIKTGTEPG